MEGYHINWGKQVDTSCFEKDRKNAFPLKQTLKGQTGQTKQKHQSKPCYKVKCTKQNSDKKWGISLTKRNLNVTIQTENVCIRTWKKWEV